MVQEQQVDPPGTNPLAAREYRQITSGDAKELQLFLYIHYCIIVTASLCSASTVRVDDQSYNFNSNSHIPPILSYLSLI